MSFEHRIFYNLDFDLFQELGLSTTPHHIPSICERTDIYWVIPGRSEVGIKERDIEVTFSSGRESSKCDSRWELKYNYTGGPKDVGNGPIKDPRHYPVCDLEYQNSLQLASSSQLTPVPKYWVKELSKRMISSYPPDINTGSLDQKMADFIRTHLFKMSYVSDNIESFSKSFDPHYIKKKNQKIKSYKSKTIFSPSPENVLYDTKILKNHIHRISIQKQVRKFTMVAKSLKYKINNKTGTQSNGSMIKSFYLKLNSQHFQTKNILPTNAVQISSSSIKLKIECSSIKLNPFTNKNEEFFNWASRRIRNKMFRKLNRIKCYSWQTISIECQSTPPIMEFVNRFLPPQLLTINRQNVDGKVLMCIIDGYPGFCETVLNLIYNGVSLDEKPKYSTNFTSNSIFEENEPTQTCISTEQTPDSTISEKEKEKS